MDKKNFLIDELGAESIAELTQRLVKDSAIIEYSQIPEIDLYMDQLTTFIEEKLKAGRRNAEDKILTKTMINNYTKDKILPPPDKKKYNKEQISLLILIYHLKTGMAISDISKLFESAKKSGMSVETLYLAFESLNKSQLERLSGQIDGVIEETAHISPDCGSEKINVILSLILEANLKKRLAERLIDTL